MRDWLMSGRIDWLWFTAFGLGSYFLAWSDARTPRWLRNTVLAVMTATVLALVLTLAGILAGRLAGRDVLALVEGPSREAVTTGMRLVAMLVASLSLAGIGEIVLRLVTGEGDAAVPASGRQALLMGVTLAATLATSLLLAFGSAVPAGAAIVAFIGAVMVTERAAASVRIKAA